MSCTWENKSYLHTLHSKFCPHFQKKKNIQFNSIQLFHRTNPIACFSLPPSIFLCNSSLRIFTHKKKKKKSNFLCEIHRTSFFFFSNSSRFYFYSSSSLSRSCSSISGSCHSRQILRSKFHIIVIITNQLVKQI